MIITALKSKAASIWPNHNISGPILFSMWALTLCDYFLDASLGAVATVCAWIFVAIEIPRLKPKQKPLILALGAAGILFSVLGWLFGSEATALELLDEHLKLAMLLTAISFISLAIKPHASDTSKGLKSYLSTLFGMHFFSSVANFSALPVVGDQLQRNGTLDRLSQSIMTRSFSLAVLWSPFLSILPLVLEQVSGAQVSNIYMFSIPLAAIGILLTILEARLRYKSRFNNYHGYPMKMASLTLPLLLIVSVLSMAWTFPETSTVILVSITAVIIPLIIVSNQKGLYEGGRTLKRQIFVRLSESRTEVSLFLCAGLLAAGVKSCISVGLFSLPFTETNAVVASICLVTIVFIASLGVNQLAVVAIFAGLLADVTTTPTIMAIAYIFATALSMYSSTFSGTNMILRVRYHCSTRDIIKHQTPYTVVMILIGISVLHIMEAMGVK